MLLISPAIRRSGLAALIGPDMCLDIIRVTISGQCRLVVGSACQMPLPLADSGNVSNAVSIVHGGFCTSFWLAGKSFQIPGWLLWVFQERIYYVVRVSENLFGVLWVWEWTYIVWVKIQLAQFESTSLFGHSAPLTSSVSKNGRQRLINIEINLRSAVNCPTNFWTSLCWWLYVQDCFYLFRAGFSSFKIHTCKCTDILRRIGT